MLETVIREWGGKSDLWVFAYASLIWRPEFEHAEERFATIHGYHRALKMWSRLNRGTPDCPGLVFGLLPGGSCKGMVFRIPQAQVASALPALWEREMPNGVYDPKWLRCQTDKGDVRALAFTLSRHSPNHTGVLSEDVYRQIFSDSGQVAGPGQPLGQTGYAPVCERLLTPAGASLPVRPRQPTVCLSL
ncbi:MAG: gamma-glutamylcyclotransferase [Polaromonas sp.]|nr:gamma-glutamylcyclotransferase [Polaromonas sp.]